MSLSGDAKVRGMPLDCIQRLEVVFSGILYFFRAFVYYARVV